MLCRWARPADREAAAEALKLLPADGQPTVQQVRDARGRFGRKPGRDGLEGFGRLTRLSGLNLNPSRRKQRRNVAAAPGKPSTVKPAG